MRAALAFLLVSCSSESVPRPAPPPVNWASLESRPVLADAGAPSATAKERAAAEAYLTALARPGMTGLGGVLDVDVHVAFAGFKDAFGRDNVIRVHQAMFGGFEPRSFTASRLFLTDRAQIVEWTMSGAQLGSKKPVGFPGVTLLWTKDDGSITDVHLYFDEALVGAAPKPVAPSPRQDVEQTRSVDERANVAAIRKMLGALEEKNEAAYVDARTDDLGRSEARAYFKTMHKAIAQLDTTVENIWGIGSFVVVEYHIDGEQRGPLGAIPAQKDNLIKMFVVDVIELQAGKVARVWRYEDPSQILAVP